MVAVSSDSISCMYQNRSKDSVDEDQYASHHHMQALIYHMYNCQYNIAQHEQIRMFNTSPILPELYPNIGGRFTT